MPRPPVKALRQGTRIESFEIRSVLGTGAFGITYLAYDHDLAQQVAIKEFCPARLAARSEDGTTLRSHSSGHAKYFNSGRTTFLAEARALAQFRHPAIVRVSRHMEYFGTAYIAMDYERGETLRSRIRALSVLDESEARDVFIPLLDGLSAVHERSFMHGDIKPDNILIRADGSPVLIDFGAAQGNLSRQQRATFHTFTPAYAPPELHSESQDVGPWSDVYCVGATLYHCLAGRPPPAASDRVFACYFERPDPLDAALRRSFPNAPRSTIDTLTHALALKVPNRLQNVDGIFGAWSAGRSAAAEPRTLTPVTPPVAHESSLDGDRSTASASYDSAGTSSAQARPTITVAPEIRRMAERHLAQFVGASFAGRQAAEHADTCTSHDEFYQRLAANIESDSKREEFIAAVTLGEYLR